jgi:hypothetical protein
LSVHTFLIDKAAQPSIRSPSLDCAEYVQAVANAAIGDSFYPLAKVPLDNFEQHWRINVLHQKRLIPRSQAEFRRF